MYRVLIVEDEDIIRKGLIFTMDWTKYGCTVAGEAVDGNDGLKKIAEVKPDIVITDVKMPFKDGLQMLFESNEKSIYETIIISGYSEFNYAQKAISLGVSNYLLKPIDMNDLGKALTKLTNKISQKRIIQKAICENENDISKKVLDLSFYQQHNVKYVDIMLDYIKQHYKEKISIVDLCNKLYVSSTYLNIQFKKETNYTFNDFLNRYRILRSIELLKTGKLKIYQIAEFVGFQDYKYYIQVFKKYVGCAPMKFLNSDGSDNYKKA